MNAAPNSFVYVGRFVFKMGWGRSRVLSSKLKPLVVHAKMSNSVQATEFTPKLHDRGNGTCLILVQKSTYLIFISFRMFVNVGAAFMN